MKPKIPFLGLLFLCSSFAFAKTKKAQSQTNPDACVIQPSQLESLLALPTSAFDQDQSGGWRVYVQKGCFLQAAMLIDAYVANRPAKMTVTDRRNLSFHAGQLYAMAGLKSIGAGRILGSLNMQEKPDSDLAWNTYVLATAAFLHGDKQELVDQRARLAVARPTDGNKINLGVVDGLVSCFDKPYNEAYSKCRPATKKSTPRPK